MVRLLIAISLFFLNNVLSSQEDHNKTCQIQPFQAYIYDMDSFSNIRATPGGAIVLKINTEYLYGCIITIVDYKDGWFRINRISGIDSYEISGFEGWIHHSIVGAATTYDLDVLDAPNGKTKRGTLKGENGHTFKIIDARCEWIKIKYNKLVGWVKSKKICGNPVTTCP